MSYHGATICLNGHVMSKYDTNSQNHCSTCGEKTYSYCTQCNSPIRGLINPEGVAIIGKRPYTRPDFCYNCGAPYPWTQKILDNAVELLSLDDELDIASKELIKNSIPDLLVDTPTTPVAIAKYQKHIAKAGEIVRNSMYNLLIDVVSETVKNTLFR